MLDDLRPLCETNLEGAVVGAVVDNGVDLLLKRNDPRVCDVPRVRDYFNAGILLIELNRWRRQVSESVADYLAGNNQPPFVDQDALNVACDGLWKPLDSRWNFQDHQGTKIAEIPPEEKPGIVHFMAHIKPWNATDLSANAKFYDGFRGIERVSLAPLVIGCETHFSALWVALSAS